MSSSSAPGVDASTPPPVAKRSVGDLARAAVSGWLGTALEFMDFQLYSLAAALVFSQIFFAGGDAAMAVVLAMATYGVGYVARPVGAFVFARIGDKIGRRIPNLELPWAQIHTLITDTRLEDDARRRIEAHGVRLICTAMAEHP